MKLAKEMGRDETMVVTVSGRGDKDVTVVQDYLNSRKKKGKRHAK
jgi:tryptophan synthase beta chain